MGIFHNPDSLDKVIDETLDKPIDEQICIIRYNGRDVGYFISNALMGKIQGATGLVLRNLDG